MIISKSGALAAIVKEGDYLVFKAEKLGISVEYSPDGPSDGPVVGAFAARHGVAYYLNAREAADLLREHPLEAEEKLAHGIECGSQYGRVRNTLDKMIDAIRVYADAGYTLTADHPIWHGKLLDFHNAVVEPMTGLHFNEHVKRLYRRLPDFLPGVKMETDKKRVFVTVDWKAVETPE